MIVIFQNDHLLDCTSLSLLHYPYIIFLKNHVQIWFIRLLRNVYLHVSQSSLYWIPLYEIALSYRALIIKLSLIGRYWYLYGFYISICYKWFTLQASESHISAPSLHIFNISDYMSHKRLMYQIWYSKNILSIHFSLLDLV